MAHITIYLDDEVLAKVRAAAEAGGVSQGHWISEAVRLRIGRKWPRAVQELVGAWQDIPTSEEIRSQQRHSDVSREKL